MAKSKSWKKTEDLFGEFFGVRRNPLSGRNNLSDDGSRRLGDLLYQKAVIEVKQRKKGKMASALRARKIREIVKKFKLSGISFMEVGSSATLTRAIETEALAAEHGLPFLHAEKMKNDKNIWVLVADKYWIQKFVTLFINEIEGKVETKI
jgi:hypothetical protein